MPRSTTTGTPRLDERAAAFRFVFQHAPNSERELRVAAAMHLVDRGDLDPAGILVARSDGQVVGAMLCQTIPGASGLVWPPQTVRSPCQREWEDRLVEHAVAWLQQRGAKLGQALLGASEAHLGAPLERNGFARITRLWYMRCPLPPPTPLRSWDGRLVYQSYDRCDQDLFHHTLLATYEGTLDCPEVNDVREIEEIIAGHQAQGCYDPERWLLALEDNRAVGVLLLTAMPEWTSWDISYVGVVPPARGRGLGRALLTHALQAATDAGVLSMTLSVDERNRPAWELYAALGFQPYEQREVFLAIWKRRATPDRSA
jgi:ribosomal protein S18 acetylase RimI-like enzyme